jgi:tyrosyl-tRNA synthetase
VDYPSGKISAGVDVVSFLAETNIFSSKGEARKMVQGGGVSINRKKIDDVQSAIDNAMLLHGKYLLVQKGKKNYYLVSAS